MLFFPLPLRARADVPSLSLSSIHLFMSICRYNENSEEEITSTPPARAIGAHTHNRLTSEGTGSGRQKKERKYVEMKTSTRITCSNIYAHALFVLSGSFTFEFFFSCSVRFNLNEKGPCRAVCTFCIKGIIGTGMRHGIDPYMAPVP